MRLSNSERFCDINFCEWLGIIIISLLWSITITHSPFFIVYFFFKVYKYSREDKVSSNSNLLLVPMIIVWGMRFPTLQTSAALALMILFCVLDKLLTSSQVNSSTSFTDILSNQPEQKYLYRTRFYIEELNF